MTLKRLVATVVLLAAACEDPSAVVEVPPVRSMTMFVVLDPDEATQPVLIKPASPGGVIRALGGSVRRDGRVAASLAPTDDASGNEFHACLGRYGAQLGFSHPRCLDFAFRPAPGATYRVEAFADGYPTASGSATVPGGFRIVQLSAPGTPPGTERLEVTWTRSAGAYRYVVALRSQGLAACLGQRRECAVAHDPGDWQMATADTSVSTVIPAAGVARGQGGWVLDVYAMDRNVYEYLTTGIGGEPFPVPPAQNVTGGYGSVGAWVRRSHAF